MNKTQIMLYVCNFIIGYGTARLWLASSFSPIDTAAGIVVTSLFIILVFVGLDRLAKDK